MLVVRGRRLLSSLAACGVLLLLSITLVFLDRESRHQLVNHERVVIRRYVSKCFCFLAHVVLTTLALESFVTNEVFTGRMVVNISQDSWIHVLVVVVFDQQMLGKPSRVHVSGHDSQYVFYLSLVHVLPHFEIQQSGHVALVYVNIRG